MSSLPQSPYKALLEIEKRELIQYIHLQVDCTYGYSNKFE